jgi:hypothetical protein
MERYFFVAHLSVERLLAEWRWLCPTPMNLVARNAFGDLFLRDEAGKIFKLDVSVGQINQIAESEKAFRELAFATEHRKRWFCEDNEMAAFEHGLKPDASQCIAFRIPLQFAQSGTPDNLYVTDLYEQVSFLGDLNRQTSEMPDGTKVRLRVQKPD